MHYLQVQMGMWRMSQEFGNAQFAKYCKWKFYLLLDISATALLLNAHMVFWFLLISFLLCFDFVN